MTAQDNHVYPPPVGPPIDRSPLMGPIPAGLLTAVISVVAGGLFYAFMLSILYDQILDSALPETGIELRLQLLGVPMAALSGFLLHWLVGTGDRRHEGTIGAAVWVAAAVVSAIPAIAAQGFGGFDSRGWTVVVIGLGALSLGAVRGTTRGPVGMALFAVLSALNELTRTLAIIHLVDSDTIWRFQIIVFGTAAVSMVLAAIILTQLKPAAFAWRPRRSAFQPSMPSAPPGYHS